MTERERADGDPNVRSVVIVGGGTAGWMAAAALARAFGPRLDIAVVESEEIGTVGVGEATIPQIKLFNEFLGLDEDAFLKATQGTFKLGIEFRNWARPGDAYIHAFGPIGASIGLLTFQHYWLHAATSGLDDDLWAYSLNARAARSNRFARLQQIDGTKLPGIAYAFHFDAGLYARALRTYAEERGVARVEGRIASVALRPEDGFVDAVILEDGRRAAADLFVDCSGFRGLVIEQALSAGYEDWTRWLPCDRAVAAPCARTEPVLPFTQSIAGDAGWRWRIPLQHRTGNGHVYCSAFMDDQAAADALVAAIDGPPTADPRFLSFVTGRRKRQWVKNCVSLGLASGFMEPLESTSIHLIQSGVSRLIAMFPDRFCDDALVDEFNRQSRFEFERIRDFLILHYKANERVEAPFWRACQEMDIPDTLAAKVELFRASGRIYREHEELFTEDGWLQVLVGQRFMPRAAHPLAFSLSTQQYQGFFSDLRKVLARAVDGLPGHGDFIERHCKAPPPDQIRRVGQ
ncbi:MAG: tryptophan halogenase [Alphaproteobacteria bacterium]|nr:tryptophan halogenase [Alphaproteobacteria bacterium]